MPLDVSIVIPCLNEAETVAKCVTIARHALEKHGLSGEVIVADNGSTDGSRELAETAGARVVAVPNRGYGAALIGGIEAAEGTYVIMGDADASYDFGEIEPFIEALRGGAQLVMGSRFKGKIMDGAMPPLHRWVGNPVLTFIGNLLFSTHISDYHCGMRGFHRESILKLNLRTFGMEFATEMVTKAAIHGFTIAEVPIVYYPDGRSRRSHLRTWRDGWRHLKFMLMLSPSWVFIQPGILLTLVSALAYLASFVSGVSTEAQLRYQIISSVGILIGMQVLIFGILSRLFSIKFGLLPTHPRWERIANGLSIDNSVLLGGVLIFLAILAMFTSLNMSNTSTLIHSLILLAVGTDILFLGFAISMIRIKDYFR